MTYSYLATNLSWWNIRREASNLLNALQTLRDGAAAETEDIVRLTILKQAHANAWHRAGGSSAHYLHLPGYWRADCKSCAYSSDDRLTAAPTTLLMPYCDE